MSFGRGRRDMDGLAGDLAREEEHRRVSHLASSPSPATGDEYGRSARRDPPPGRMQRIVRQIRRAIGS